MPLIPGAPAPITQNNTYNSFSGTYNASGVTNTSGVGELRLYEIIRQDMTITYFRHPKVNISVDKLSLSAAPTHNAAYMYTDLTYEVRANYSKTYEWGNFTTSTYIQNQKFRIIANDTDMYGDFYGSLSDGGQLTLGVAGVVETEVPFYSRRLISEGDQQQVIQRSVCLYSDAYKQNHNVFTVANPQMVAASEKLGDREAKAKQPHLACSFQ